MIRRRWLLPLCALICIAPGVAAFAEQRSPQPSGSEKNSSEIWELANFALFASGLGWFVASKGRRFFAARSADIEKAIKDATGLKMDADFRYSEIDRKMASLAEAIKQMRDQSALEMQRAHQRMLHQTQQQSERICQSALLEIRALEAEGRRRLSRFMAGLTLSLAYRRLQEQPSDTSKEGMLDEFVNMVEQAKK